MVSLVCPKLVKCPLLNWYQSTAVAGTGLYQQVVMMSTTVYKPGNQLRFGQRVIFESCLVATSQIQISRFNPDHWMSMFGLLCPHWRYVLYRMPFLLIAVTNNVTINGRSSVAYVVVVVTDMIKMCFVAWHCSLR